MKALVVEDDPVLADVVAFAFKREGFRVIQAFDGLRALQRWAEERPDLVILDINLPKMDGYAVCQRIRKETDTPIIMLTVRDDDDDVVRGLEVGADVYMTKPFSPRQLVARAHSLLRRSSKPSRPSRRQIGCEPNEKMNWGVILDKDALIHLSPLERRLLEYFVENTGRILTYKSMIDRIWGKSTGNRGALRQLVHRLRNKIEKDPSRPLYITNVPGQGYRLDRDHNLVRD